MQSSKLTRDETSATHAVGLNMAPLRAPALKKGPDGCPPGAPGDTTCVPNASQCACACG